MVSPSAGRKGRRHREAKRRLRSKTQVCVLCGHAGAFELHHIPPRKALLANGLDPDDPQYHHAAHGTSCPCPTCGQRCNQVMGDRMVARPRMRREWNDPPTPRG